MDTLLLNLAQTYGPTANEKRVKRIINDELEKNFDEIKTDALGNFIGCKKGTDKDAKTIMITVPMDQKCFIITHVEKQGKYKFSILGGFDFSKIVDTKVVFENGVEGVILLEESASEPTKVSDLYIKTQIAEEDQKGLIKLGSSAVLKGEYVEGLEKITSVALYPRAGVKVLIDIVKALDEDLKSDLFIVFTCHGMVESRGATTAAYGINPDIGISIGAVPENDGPKVGQGPVILTRDMAAISHPDLMKEFEEVAEKTGINIQRAVSTEELSDAAGILQAGCDTKIISLALAVKDMTTDKEQVSKTDMDDLKKLITTWLQDK